MRVRHRFIPRVSPSSRRVLARTAAVVAAAGGAQGVLSGTAGVLGTRRLHVAPNIDSEFRFFAAWYLAAGALLWRSTSRAEPEPSVVQAFSAAMLIGAVGRMISMFRSGRPHPFFVLLLGLEIGVPIVLIADQLGEGHVTGDNTAPLPG